MTLLTLRLDADPWGLQESGVDAHCFLTLLSGLVHDHFCEDAFVVPLLRTVEARPRSALFFRRISPSQTTVVGI